MIERRLALFLLLVSICAWRTTAQPAAETNAYLVRITVPAAKDAAAIAKSVAATYGGRLESPVDADGTFTITLDNSVADLLGRDPRVVRLELAQQLSPTRLETNSHASPWTIGPYAYDSAGNITALGDDVYDYDLYSRLKTATTSGITQKYTYDRYGNLKSMQTGTTTIPLTVETATNRLTHYNDNPLSYDAEGRVSGVADTVEYAYDSNGMMTSSGPPNVPSNVYLYTVSDERVASVFVNDTGEISSSWTFRDPAGKVLRRFDKQSDGTQWKWIWRQDYIYRGNDMLASERDALPRTVHYYPDHLGTPRLVTGNGGVTVGSHKYHPFGGEALTSGLSDAKKFTGHERDPSGLDYMHARYYNWAWARFLSVDPGKDWDLRRPQSWNMYSYVRNNPMNRIDPTGRCGESPSFIGPTAPCAAASSESKPKREPGAAKAEPAGGPPVPVPGIPGADWKPNRDPQNPRGGTYGPTKPRKGKGGGQPSGSWEGDAPVPHWDIDDGLGNRRRYDENGNFITPEQAHGKPPKRTTLSSGDVVGAIGLAIVGTAIAIMTGGGAALQPSPAGVAIMPTTLPQDLDKDCPTCA